MVRKRIFICFLILAPMLYILIYTVQISHTGSFLKIHNASGIDNVYSKTMDSLIKERNLTAIRWAHAVNSQKELNDAFKSNIDMIEADIILGTLVNDTSHKEMPVMGHPPANTSDISLEDFLKQILNFNNNNPARKKGVKLDFKSTIVFKGSLGILQSMWSLMKYPIWLNADIIQGPVDELKTLPVDPSEFFAGCKLFDDSILSIGWTTLWGYNYTEGSYTDTQINNMIEAIKLNDITTTRHEITFPVRAGIAAQSLPQLRALFTSFNDTNKVTLTIWSSKNDSVNIELLRNLIFSFGVDKVYLDVPEELSSKLHLDQTGDNVIKNTGAAVNRKCIPWSLVHCILFVLSFIYCQKYFLEPIL